MVGEEESGKSGKSEVDDLMRADSRAVRQPETCTRDLGQMPQPKKNDFVSVVRASSGLEARLTSATYQDL